MHIPAEIRVLGPIQRGSVFYFEEETLTTPDAHYFIVLNKNPRIEELLVFVCASSQVEKRTQRALKLGFPAETLVYVSPDEYVLFTKDTVIDCNSVFEKTPQSLIDKLTAARLRVCPEIMSPEIVKKLKIGIAMSNQAAERVKRLIAD
jgi:hypothetical protein